MNTGLNTTQVVVKELKCSAGVQEQMQFLEEAQPYRYVFASVRLSLRWKKDEISDPRIKSGIVHFKNEQ